MTATTTATRRKWDVAAWYALLDTPDPKRGRPWSRRAIAEELGLSPAAVAKAFAELEGNPPSDRRRIPGQGKLPWKLPEHEKMSWAARGARLLIARSEGVELSPEDTSRLVGFKDALTRMNRSQRTVVAFDRLRNNGEGGWVYRPRAIGEEDGRDIVAGFLARKAEFVPRE